jgi:hypothetical protein
MYRARLTAILGTAILLVAIVCRADDVPATQPSGAPKTGEFDLTFTQRSPLSARSELAQRLNLKESAMGDDYDLSKCPFKTYVPANYDPSVPVGIFVYLGYKDSVSTPPQWHPVLDASHLIFITPTWHSSNQYAPAIPLWQSAGLALDAVDNLEKLYKIDTKRIYGMAWNEGATPIAFATSDVFTGFVMSMDPGWYRRVWVGNMYYEITISPPPEGKFISLAQPHPFVLISEKGTDARSDPVARKASEMKREDFDHILQIGLSLSDDLHYPNFSAEWFGQQVLPFLDKSSSGNSTPIAATTTPSGGESAAPAEGPSHVQSLLAVAKLLIANNQFDLARPKLEQIVKNYPNDPAAAEAKKLLDQIGAK